VRVKAFKILITILFLIPSIFALELVEGDYYIVNSTLDIAGGGEIPPGTLVMLSSSNEGRWDVSLQISGRDGLSEVKRVSQTWFEKSSTYFGPVQEDVIEDAVSKAILETVDLSIQEALETELAPLANCAPSSSIRPKPRPQRSEPVISNTRPVARPENLSVPLTINADLDALLFKSDSQKDAYLACYEAEPEYTDDYRRNYKNSISIVSRTATSVANGASERIDEGDFNALLTCLVFRESAHFKGGSSHSGAVGLGQFTGIAVTELGNMLTHNVRDRSSLNEISELGRLWASGEVEEVDYQRSLSRVVSEMDMNSRRDEIRAFWEALPFDKPAPSAITKSYLGDNDNHQIVIASSAAMLRDCSLRLRNERSSMNANLRLLACAGAYNMGVGGFKRNALSSNSNGGIEAWVENLRNSGSNQANETINHLISINRCIDKSNNYPPCGTRSSYCSELENTDVCSDSDALKCVGECR